MMRKEVIDALKTVIMKYKDDEIIFATVGIETKKIFLKWS